LGFYVYIYIYLLKNSHNYLYLLENILYINFKY